MLAQQEDDLAEPSDAGAVPPPKQLTLERQLNKSILIGMYSKLSGVHSTVYRSTGKRSTCHWNFFKSMLDEYIIKKVLFGIGFTKSRLTFFCF
jgi:hypothetical protein